MKSILGHLEEKFAEATHRAFPELREQQIEIFPEITLSTQQKFGHYQYNSAMKLAKLVKQPPKKIAELILAQMAEQNKMGEQDNLISHLEIAGPGFINITLHPQFLSQKIDFLLRDSHLGIDFPIKPQKIIIDFSSPNIAKEMHVGHLRSTVIGDCLARLFEFLGHDVLRQNHIGDWGTAFGMLIRHLKEEAPEILTGKQSTNIQQLLIWYKESKKKFDEDPVFKQQAQQEVVELQQGNEKSRKAWEVICQISRKAYQEIYDLLDVQLTERGESFYNPYLPQIVADLEKKELIEYSDGAKCLFVEGFKNREGDPLPLMIQKSDGGYTYDTTDMATIYHRIAVEKGNRLIYVIDAGQSTHMQMIFKAAEKAGYLRPKEVRVDHVAFGLVLGADGKKFRTRSGDTERLIDLLLAGIEQANTILKERNLTMEETERNALARALGIGAIKYADLSNHRMGDYTFSYDRMLRFDGNTAAFLLYSYVRIGGIKRKVGKDPLNILKDTKIELKEPAEIDLGLHILRFHETLEQFVDDLLPNRLCDYLYQLAEKFNAFFRDCRVEGSPQEKERLLLCEATEKVLRQGLYILGVPLVEKM